MDENKNPLSIEFDDDNENYVAFSEFLVNDTERKKNRIANEIEKIGDELLSEIEMKKSRQEAQKREYISYILKYSKKYDENILMRYSYEDVFEIYNELVKEKKSAFVKFFHFLFNIE